VGTVVPVHSVKRVRRGSRDISPLILNLGTRWRWVFSFTTRPDYLRSRNL